MAIKSAGIGGAVIDHGTLTGLLDDDHPQYLLLAGRAGGQVIGSTAHSGGNSTDIAQEGALLIGNAIAGVAFNPLMGIDAKFSAITNGTLMRLTYDLSALSGAASGTLNVLNASLTGVIGYTSGSFVLNGLIFNPSLTVPSGVTLTSLAAISAIPSLGTTTGGNITNEYGFYAEVRAAASGGPTITNVKTYYSSPAWRSAITLATAFTAAKAILSAYGGTATDCVAFDVESNFGANANVTTWSGLRIPNITGPGTIWGINITGTMNNRMAGKLRIGDTTAPVQALEVVGIIQAHNSAAIRYRGDFNPTGTDLVLYMFDDTGGVELPVSFGLNRYVQVSPTGSYLRILAGTSTIGPLKFTEGVNLTVPVAGTMEWDGARAYLTQTVGPTRKTIMYLDDPPIGSYAPGSFTLADGQFLVHVKQLRLTGTQRATLQGDSRLVIMN